MKRISVLVCLVLLGLAISFSCNPASRPARGESNEHPASGSAGFPGQVAYGRHLVEITGCGDCHTPKRMTAMGPVPDTTLILSGHSASLPAPAVDRKEAESKGLAITSDMTAWVGPWGISYAANLTPDETGIGSWTESQFFRAMRQGKFKGLDGSRQLLPPMPWEDFAMMDDDELKAIFAYLKSIKPIHNVVPEAVPPVTSVH